MEIIKTLPELYEYYNVELFNRQLLPCVITLSHKGKIGNFIPKRWRQNDEKEHHYIHHEITINLDYVFKDEELPSAHPLSNAHPLNKKMKLYKLQELDRKDELFHSTLVQQMVHLWQYDFGHPGKNGYHNKEWFDKMHELGLEGVDMGWSEEKEWGYKVGHYVIDDGKFELSYKKIKDKVIFPFRLESSLKDKNETKKRGKRVKYTCKCPLPNNVWGKPNLILTCEICKAKFDEKGN